MPFRRTYTLETPMKREEVVNRLLGSHVKIHDLDFEVLQDKMGLTIFPHAEQVVEIKTLPNTHVDLIEQDGKTKLTVTSRIREIDFGGVLLVMILCSLLIVVAGVLFVAFKSGTEHIASGVLAALSLGIYILLRVRLNSGYFDYIKKVKEHVVSKLK